MTDKHASKLVIELAKTLIGAMPTIAPDWQRAFFRFQADDEHYGSTGSYVTPQGITLFDAFDNEALFDEINSLGSRLREVTAKNGQKFCVCLLTVDSDFNYKASFENADPKKRSITKVDGASGIPEGFE